MSTNTSPAWGPLNMMLSANDLSDPNLRLGLAAALGQSGFDGRDRYDAFGWTVNPDGEEYAAMYLRNAFGGGLIDKAAQLAWRHDPEITDTADAAEDDAADGGGQTAFEKAVGRLATDHDFWTYATRTHRAAGFGEYALLFIDFDDVDDLDSLSKSVEYDDGSLDNIRGYRVIPQFAVDEVEHGDFGSERWGEPEHYHIDWSEDVDDDLDNTGGTSKVHYTRVIEVPSKPPLTDEYQSRPRMERILNTLYDIEKLLGSAAEMSYRGADKGLHINWDPTKVDPSSVDDDGTKSDVREWYHGLQPTLNTVGAEVNDLGGKIRDPGGALEAELTSLSAATGFSKQFIEGAAAGEIASAETNMRNDFGEIRERQQQYVEPYIVRRGLTVHMQAGVLPRPEGGQFEVEWPDLFELSDEQEATIKQKRSQTAKNLGLMGEPAQQYVAEGEFVDESAPTMQPVDESEPAVANQFNALADSATANDFTPELHPRDSEGKFAEVPGSGIADAVDNIEQKIELFAEEELSLPEGVDAWDKSTPGEESLSEGDIVKVDDTTPSLRDPNRSPTSKIFRIEEDRGDGTAIAAGITGQYEGVEREIHLDASGRESNPGSRYSSTYYPTGKLRPEAARQLETEPEKINRVLGNLGSEERIKAAQLVAQEGSPSDEKLPQFKAVFDALSQDELRETFRQTATTKMDAGITRNLNISWFEGGVPGNRTDDTPDLLTANSETLGYLTSRMDRDTLTAAVDETTSELDDESSIRDRVVRAGAYYGKNAAARNQIIDSYPDADLDENVVAMQQATSANELKDAFLEDWVKSEMSAATQHMVLSLGSAGPNTPETTSAYTAGKQVFAENSAGVPLAPIEPTPEMAAAVEKLSQQATEYHEGTGVPDLHRGVRNEVTTHGTVESWSKSESVAESFDGHSVLEATANPEDILISQDMLGEDWPQPENIKRSEEEYILMGGAFASGGS